MKTTLEEKLFSYACNGNIKALKNYYDKGGKPNRRMHRFNTEASLIMGALRNHQFDTVKFLMANGEKITEEEFKAIDKEANWLDMLRLVRDEYKKD